MDVRIDSIQGDLQRQETEASESIIQIKGKMDEIMASIREKGIELEPEEVPAMKTRKSRLDHIDV